MPRILIPILALACLVLVGCEERISPEEYIELNAMADTIVAQHKMLEATIEGILSYIPCPPCTVFAMPPGTWVKTEVQAYRAGDYIDEMDGYFWLFFKCQIDSLADSVFLPRKE